MVDGGSCYGGAEEEDGGVAVDTDNLWMLVQCSFFFFFLAFGIGK